MRRHQVRIAPLLPIIVAIAAAAGCQTRELPRSEPVGRTVAVTAATLAPDRAAPAQSSEDPPLACATLRDVSISDIVRIDDKTLFYADASAGLTIVDVTDAAAPRRLAVVPFVGTPTALFVRDGIAWVMFVDSDSRFLKGKVATVIRAIDVRTPRAPHTIGQEVREGSASIAKFVGGYLYVMRPTAQGSVVESFDVRNGALHALDEVKLEGTPAQLAASSAGLAAVTLSGDQTVVAWLDLSMDRPGAVALRQAVRVPGGVATWERGDSRIVDADEGQRVRLVTCATRSCGPAEPTTLRVVDFGAAGPARVLPSLRLTEHGGLPLTRFADDVLYVAETSSTARDATTLHIVRTEDVGSRFVSHIGLRGMLSGLVPREGSLVALGSIGAADTPVNLVMHDIDVRRPAVPRVRATVTFGSDWTWSAALDDEKALSFDPASNLVAVPFTAWRQVDKRYVTGTQLVDLGAYGGQLASTVPSEGFVERAVFLDGHLVTIGPSGVVAVDYAAMRRPDFAERGVDLAPRTPSR